MMQLQLQSVQLHHLVVLIHHHLPSLQYSLLYQDQYLLLKLLKWHRIQFLLHSLLHLLLQSVTLNVALEPEPVVDCVAIPVTPLASAVYAPSLVIVRPATAPEFTLATVNVALVPVPVLSLVIVNTSPTA